MSRPRLAPDEFANAMTVAVFQTAAALRWLEGRVQNRPKDEDTDVKAALTDADCVAQEILLTALLHHSPDVELDAEEDTPQVESFARNQSSQRVVIDPLDGTLRYLRGDGLYAILVGLEVEGRVEASLVAVPPLGVVIRAVRGRGAERVWLDGRSEPLLVSPGGRRAILSYSLGDPERAKLRDRGLLPVTGAGGAIGVSPLLDDTLGAIRTTADPAGLSRRTWVGVLPTLEAGGIVETPLGRLAEAYEPGVQTIRVASDEAGLAKLRL